MMEMGISFMNEIDVIRFFGERIRMQTEIQRQKKTCYKENCERAEERLSRKEAEAKGNQMKIEKKYK